MIEPAILDLIIYQGATFRKPFTWAAGDPAVPVDLTGWKIRMHIRGKIKDPVVILELTSEPDNNRIRISDDPETGSFEIYISAADTASLSFNSAVYDLELENPDGEVVRLLKGEVSLDPEVTRVAAVV